MANEIVSPIPGIFYRKPNPESPPYVEVGQKIKEGDIVGLVEVMKSFNEIPSEFSGIVKEIRVEDGGEIEAGGIIAVIE